MNKSKKSSARAKTSVRASKKSAYQKIKSTVQAKKSPPLKNKKIPAQRRKKILYSSIKKSVQNKKKNSPVSLKKSPSTDAKRTAPLIKEKENATNVMDNDTCEINFLLSGKVIQVAQPAEVVNDDLPASEAIKLLDKDTPLMVSRKYEIVGIISDLSLVKNIQNKDIASLTANDLKEPILTIDALKNIGQAIEIMESKGTTVLAVTSKTDIFGVVTAKEIRKYLIKKITGGTYLHEALIETKIDEFIALVKRGPISPGDAQRKLGVTAEQIENWIEILDKQEIMKIEKKFGKLMIKDERKV